MNPFFFFLDLKAFERRLTEVIDKLQPTARLWRSKTNTKSRKSHCQSLQKYITAYSKHNLKKNNTYFWIPRLSYFEVMDSNHLILHWLICVWKLNFLSFHDISLSLYIFFFLFTSIINWTLITCIWLSNFDI